MAHQLLEAPETGLSAAEVAEREAAGQVNTIGTGPSRTTGDIIRANLFTRYNLILTILLVVILAVAPVQDALFGVIMVVNATIGIVQELRAKRTLDRLRLIEAPRATVVRDGVTTEIAVEKVVLDDILEVRSGDQLVVDGTVIWSDGLEIDESLLTGEADPVAKNPGDSCRSGSVVVAGVGRIRTTAVGADAYAVGLAREAKRFTMVRSDLKRAIDMILAVVGWSLIPMGVILVWSQIDLEAGFNTAARGAVAGMVAMIPQGLVLLTSIAFAVAVVRLGRRQTLVQELPAVEILARVDTVCLDKTGTLTQGRLRCIDAIPIHDEEDPPAWREAVGALAWSDPDPNATLRALRNEFPDPDWQPVKRVPFTSHRGWSGAQFDEQGTWLLGAPERVAPDHSDVHEEAEELAARGHRVLLVAHEAQGEPAPAALLVLGDALRPDAAATLQFFARQGVETKVISGDHPDTVAAVAAGVGLHDPAGAVDATALPADDGELDILVEERRLFGRVNPHAKRRLIRSLQRSGKTVAMTGDGVNDVLALKDADIGVAMGSGSAASRSVAQLVLLDNSFDALPHIVDEGRRVIANIERVANLFLAKTVYAILLALATAAAQLAFPFLPRHLSLVGSLTIGIPGFFLALEPSADRAHPGILRRVWRFALPTGLLAAGASFAAYGIARIEDAPLDASRTTATFVLAAVGLFILTVISRPLTPARQSLIGAMAILMVLAVLIPPASRFWALPLPRPVVFLAGIGIAALTGTVMWLSLRAIGWFQMAAAIVTDPPLRTATSHRIRRRVSRRMHELSGGRVGVSPEAPQETSPVAAPPDRADQVTDRSVQEQLELPLQPPSTDDPV